MHVRLLLLPFLLLALAGLCRADKDPILSYTVLEKPFRMHKVRRGVSWPLSEKLAGVSGKMWEWVSRVVDLLTSN